MPLITSMLDNDLYKFTQQRAVLGYRQGVPVRYVFNNRRPEGKFNHIFFTRLQAQIEAMGELKTKDFEIDFLAEKCPYLGADYLEYLRNFRYDPTQITFANQDNDLQLNIQGPWEKAILWEVPLMAIISQLYFEHCDQDWDNSVDVQQEKILQKSLALGNLKFTDFGTRRRRNYATQDLVVGQFKKLSPNFVGTSNVHLAMKHNVKPIGTMAHEFIMGISALEGLRHANRYAMQIWSKIYNGDLGTALPDTFGTEAFWGDFDGYLARLFDGVRHDSGCPFKFADRAIAAYEKLRINPLTKTIIFSDGLDIELTLKLAKYCEDRVGCGFGIGTHLTNDFVKLSCKDVSKALNMVIKMHMCDGTYVVKLSDNPMKAIGDKDALRVAFWTFFGTPLD